MHLFKIFFDENSLIVIVKVFDKLVSLVIAYKFFKIFQIKSVPMI